MAGTARNAYIQQLLMALPKDELPVKKVAVRKSTATTKPTPKKTAATRKRKKADS